MKVVACVLRGGGAYDPRYVVNLRNMVARHLPHPHRFVCFTDLSAKATLLPLAHADVETIPLLHDWPGWWAKMEMYDPRWPFGVLYFDLDTLIVGDLTDLWEYSGDRAALGDFYKPDRMIGSGVLSWRRGKMAGVWRAFTEDPERNMAANPLRSDHFLYQHAGPFDRWQAMLYGQVVSGKRHWTGKVPPGARVLCMHGKPRLADLPLTDIRRRIWEGQWPS